MEGKCQCVLAGYRNATLTDYALLMFFAVLEDVGMQIGFRPEKKHEARPGDMDMNHSGSDGVFCRLCDCDYD